MKTLRDELGSPWAAAPGSPGGNDAGRSEIRTMIKCDAEIGHPGNYHRCGRAARWGRRSASGQVMHYCTRHADRAHDPKPIHYRPAPGSMPFKIPAPIGERRPDGRCSKCGASGFNYNGEGYECMTCGTIKPPRTPSPSLPPCIKQYLDGSVS